MFLLYSCPATSNQPAPKATVLLVGDSLAYVLSRPLKDEARQHNVVVNSYAIGGTNTWQWGKREKWLVSSLRKWKPEWLFVVLGTNDAGVPVYRNGFFKNAKLLVDKAHRRHAKVAWITPPKIPVKTDFIYDGAKDSGADLVLDYRSVTVGLWRDKKTGKLDVHPSRKGCTDWAKQIMTEFDKEVSNEKSN